MLFKAISTVCIAAMCFAAPAAQAKTDQQSETLQQALEKRISENMTMPAFIGGRQVEGGTARVMFKVGVDGRAHDVTLAKPSGVSEIDRAAVRLISSFKALPTGQIGRPVVAVLQYRTPGEWDETVARKAMTKQVAMAYLDVAKASGRANAQETAQVGRIATSYNAAFTRAR